MAHFGCEVEFLPVGDGSSGGDSILIRYGDFEDRENCKVVVIDGGTKQSANGLIEHIQKYYKTYVIDLVISTHPDQDHASGLARIFEEFAVLELWMHRPWLVSEHLLDRFDDARTTSNSLEARLRNGLNYAHDVEQLAIEHKTPFIHEPFEGRKTSDGALHILGPSADYYYNTIIPNLDCTPMPKTQFLGVAESARRFAKSIPNFIKTYGRDLLAEPPDTSVSNNSSVIAYFTFGNCRALLTADAGVPALENAIAYAKRVGIDLTDLTLLQAPHHGSRRNIGPSTLDKLKSKSVFISCPPDGDPKHPSRRVVNAFTLRGMEVSMTKDKSIRSGHNMLSREGWTRLIPIPLYDEVEEQNEEV